MKTLSALFIGLCLCASAIAGVEGGNTELFRPVNARGELIAIKFGARHPYQDKLVEMIGRAQLPVVLKSEMLGDLTNTSVMVSNEIVTYADTQKQIQMVLSKIVKTTSKDADGRTTESTQEEYVVSEAALKLGLYMIPVNMTVKNLADTYIAAYTQANPKRVVYFSEFVDQMKEEEAMNLVLHEQAHRLEYLSAFRNDERFIEGWSASLLAYLKGEKTKDEFYAVLAANRLETREVKGIPGEVWYPGGRDNAGYYKGVINVTINASQISYVGQNKSQYVLQVSSDVFKDYPVFLKDQYISININNMNGGYSKPMSTELFTLVDTYLRRIVEKGLTLSIPLEVQYSTVASNDSNGRLFSTYVDQVAILSSAEAEKAVNDELAMLARKHGMQNNAVSGSVMALMNPDFASQVRGAISRLDTALEVLRKDVPWVYEKIVVNSNSKSPGAIQMILELPSEQKHVSASAEYGGLTFVTGLTVDGLARITVEKIRDKLIEDISPDNNYAKWLAVKGVNSLLRSARVRVMPNKQRVSDLRQLNAFLSSSKALQERLKCIARGENPNGKGFLELSFTLNLVETVPSLWWDYGYTGSDDNYARGLNVTESIRNIVDNPRAVEGALFGFVLSGAGNRASDKGQGGQVSWDPRNGRFKLGKKATSLTLGFENVLRSCSQMSQRTGD